jgi:hypothetical protein
MITSGAVIIIVLCTGAALVARTVLPSTPERTPTAASPTTGALTAPPSVPTPMPTDATPLMTTPAPTSAPPPTERPTLAPTPNPTPPSEPSPAPLPDPLGDVGAYASGDPIEGVPDGVDIRAASVGTDLQVVLQSPQGVPAELADWATEDKVLLWISLQSAAPDPPQVFTDWVFVLDLDGDLSTGRPAGSARVNPDLGYEAAIGVSYNDANGEYEPYFLVWDLTRSALVSAPEEPRFALNEARTMIGLSLPLEILTETVEQIAGVPIVTGKVRGRAAAQTRVGGQKVIDFYPDRPD